MMKSRDLLISCVLIHLNSIRRGFRDWASTHRPSKEDYREVLLYMDQHPDAFAVTYREDLERELLRCENEEKTQTRKSDFHSLKSENSPRVNSHREQLKGEEKQLGLDRTSLSQSRK